MHKDHTTQAKQKKDEREEVLKEIRQLENRQKILENKQRNEERKARFVPFPPGGENYTRSLAPPPPTKTASPGFRGVPKVTRAARHPLRVCPAPGRLNTPHRGGAPIEFCHIPVSIIKRSEGRSAVAAAAYRSGTKLTNEWDGLTHDYTRKGGVVHAEIMLPTHAPPEFADRSTLWNSVEQIEKARDSQLVREIEAALPRELSREQQLARVKPEKRELFEQRHSRELILYDAAARYLKELKDSGEEITPKAWQREIDLLTAQKQVDTIDMKAMREELKAIERLRKAADQLDRQGRDKSHDREPER